MLKIENLKNVLIIGAGHGIGLALAEKIQSEGNCERLYLIYGSDERNEIKTIYAWCIYSIKLC